MAYQSDPSSARSLEVEESHMDVPDMAGDDRSPAHRKLTAAAGMALALVFGGGLVYTSFNQAAMNPVGSTSVDLSLAHTIGPMKAADTMSLPDRPLNPSFTRPLITHDANHNSNHDTHSHSHSHSHDNDSNHHKPSKHSHKSNSDVSSHDSDSDSDVSSAHTHSSLPPVSHTSSSSSSSSSSPSPSSSLTPSSSTSRIATAGSPFNTKACEGPFPGYPYCQDRMDWLAANWNKDSATEAYYRANGVDGSNCSFLNFLNLHGFYCPEAIDAAKAKIRGVNLGGWLVLEPWITPSLFRQFDPRDNVADEWRFTEVLGKEEAKRQLQHHWDTWLTEDHIRELADSGINHVRIPFGYWIFGDIRVGEPWVDGELPYLERAIEWCNKYGLHVLLDLHGVPGSQNGFDNSGKRGVVMWADSYRDNTGRVRYPNIERSLAVIRNVTRVFTQPRFRQAVVAIEPVNEAFVSVPLEIVKDYYLQAYEIIKQGTDPLHGYDIAVVIGDSFRFGAWNGFMFPPHYRHVWIDTHIYQVFDTYRLQFSWAEHEKLTCATNKPEVSVSPLSTLVGEWSLATTDCAPWLNGYNVGSRYDGTMYGYTQVGICDGQNDVKSQVFTPEYREFLKEWAALQMDAYESGSSAGWFFWNFRTESAPQWDYLLGLKEGWMPKDHNKRVANCDTWLSQQTSSIN